MNKKGFLLYKDTIGIVKKLTPEQAGYLFKAIVAWQLDEEVELDPTLSLVFHPFEAQFIRDNKKYGEVVEQRRISGAKGGKQKQANATKRKQKVASATKCKQKVANVADSDSDREKDSDKVSVKKEPPTLNEFIGYAQTLEIYKPTLNYSLEAKYETWKEDGWKDGHGNKIKNWKTKLRNTLPYLKEVGVMREVKSDEARIRARMQEIRASL